ncbi:nephrocystin-4-like isoform X2 [Clavelina lepadiformis]|uniref:nephrocystin-4-like isoform X2 n=1 Tax=Clavelina lepadiformis TaxID=159417 RepID=UPI004043099E
MIGTKNDNSETGQNGTWYDIIEKWKEVEISREHVSDDVSTGYQFNLQSVTGHLNLNTPDAYNLEYEIRLTLFDVLYGRFIGRTWRSRKVRSTQSEEQGQHSQIKLDLPVYFHTPILDSTILLVIEIVTYLTPKNPLPGQENVTKQRSLGWGVLRLFQSGVLIKDISDGGEIPTRRLDVYQGSPRALLYMKDPIESDPQIKLVPGCQITLTFSRHIAMNTIMHLMPENVLYGADEKLPGMAESYTKHGDIHDYFWKPRLMKQCVGYIDKLSINLGTTIERFEDELCKLANYDRLKREKLTDDGKSVAVSERKLMIGVHNGFCYIQKPQFAQVEPEALVGGTKMGSFGRGKRKDPSLISLSSSTNLVLRSRIQLNEMIPHSKVAIVFQLEYILSLPAPQSNVTGSVSSLRSQPSKIMVRWASWTPYTLSRLPEQPVTVTLNGGLSANPDSLLFYKVQKNQDGLNNNGSIKFRYLTSDQPIANSTSIVGQSVLSNEPVIGTTQLHAPDVVQVKEPDDSYSVEIAHLEMAGDQHPVHAPPIQPIAQSIPTLTRASYARLYNAGFPEILDRKGLLPQIIDANDLMFRFNLEKEITDPLQTNEVCVQFLAFTTPVQSPAEAPPPTMNSIFLSFQFYRFRPVTTQRLSLVRKTDSDGRYNDKAPCILRKIEAGEQLDEGQPGLEVKYHVDPVHMKAGENSAFLKYLATHYLHIDVWNGESLLLMGSLSVPLKHLLRGGNSAVCVNHEVDVVFSEHSDVAPTFTGDLSKGGSVRPLGLSKQYRGRLHLRLGNVGYPSEDKSSIRMKKSPLVVADLTGCAFHGGSLTFALQNSGSVRANRCKGRKMIESNSELSELLLLNATRNEEGDKENAEAGKGMDADRQRKISRMNAVRNLEDENGGKPQTKIGQRALLNRQEKSLKERDLKTISSYRERLKSEHIMEMLMLSITTKHTIRPTLGIAEFVELKLKNPFTTQQTVSIECNSTDFRVVTDSREWRYFKGLAGLHTPVEENMFNFDPNSSLPQIYLRPKETVYIPFRYQSYEADHEVATQGPGHFFKPTPTSLQPVKDQHSHGTIKSKVVKAILRTSDGRPLSILQLTVDPQPHVVDQTFRFYNPEQTFLKKCIRLPPFNNNSDHQFHVVCSDPEIVCQARSLSRDEPREVFLKAPCGNSPSVRRFFLAIYNDPFLAIPAQIWQFYVHSLQRIDVNSVLGQTSRFSLVLRGTQTAPMVQCFSSHPKEMQLSPSERFLLPANGVYEVNAGVRTTSVNSNTKYMYVNVVDTEYHQLIRTWLVAVKAREPMIAKEFDIELSRSGGKGNNKMITYTNPYPNRKKFVLMTSRSDLLHFRDVNMELGPGEKTTIGLRFASGVAQSGRFPVHIFINDLEDKNEETFLINVTYV